ncbi:MAG TPA: 2-thiouracil desulfurase family protein [Bacillota bacterium]|nr:2-thiouracil desulfurase family protein [Bacillota bacterium]
MPPAISTPVPRALVSACLAGVNCRYDGGTCSSPPVIELVRTGRAVPVCPEQLGGLPTPRPPARLSGDGRAVLAGEARVTDAQGDDVTAQFLRGAAEVAALARLLGARDAILKRGSPSCDPGPAAMGVTAALLAREGLTLRHEEDPGPEPIAVPPGVGVKCWLVARDGPVLGAGLRSLLEGVKATGTITGAARAMGMSYRQAWGRIRLTERRLGMKLIDTRAGGARGGATALTPGAIELLDSFRGFEKEVGEAAAASFERHFPPRQP